MTSYCGYYGNCASKEHQAVSMCFNAENMSVRNPQLHRRSREPLFNWICLEGMNNLIKACSP